MYTSSVGLIYSFIITLAIHSSLGNVPPPAIDLSMLNQNTDIGDCQACKIVIESFMRGLKNTARGSYEGGDVAWEEEKLKKLYKRSEMRLDDITSQICEDERKYVAKCYNMFEKAEDYITEWWAQEPDESDDLFFDICISKLQVCCPKSHYGKDCSPCPGDSDNLCSGHGKCRGDGTRKGNGTCACNTGYIGDTCDQCASEYYQTYKADGKMSCMSCHQACLGGCRGGSQKDCVACKLGYILDSDEGCLDKNECDDTSTCTKDQFCLNSIGSYMCAQCDKSCSGCHGDGPDMCRKCAKGYSKKGELCIADRADEDPSDKLTTTRYMTYVGLLIATGILLPKSTTLGSVVGAMVFSYILGAEYYCMINGHSGLVDLKEFDLSQIFRT